LNKRIMRLILHLILMIFVLSLNIYAENGDEIPDNSTVEYSNEEVGDSEIGTPAGTNNTNNTGNVKKDTLNLADDLENTGNNFLDAIDGVYTDMGNADDGAIFSNVSKAIAKPVAAVTQILRALFIGIIMLLTVPDFLTLLIPALESVFGGNKGGSGGGTMGSTSGKRGGLLSADYYATVSGTGTTGGSEGGMGAGKIKNRIMEYTKKRLITTLSAIVAMLLLMTPFGFAGLMYVVRVSLFMIVYVFKMAAGGI